ncbi:MAG: T9SS type A sorting domain-containing protein, partial [bacterium]
PNTMLYWEQYDKEHSLILSILIHDNFGQDRWLIYAKNASNHWYKQGWVDMGDTTRHYNTWEWFLRNIRNDYITEYGEGVPPNGVEPEYIKELRLEHFARSEWTGDHGGTIKRLFIGVDTIPPVVQVLQPDGGEKLEIGSVYPITWDAVDDHLRIGLQTVYYSTDGGGAWHNVTGIDTLFEPIASYQFNWTVPAYPSDNCLIKVVSKDIAGNTGSDRSNAPFSICWLTSSDSTATFGNGEKIVYDRTRLHIVFSSKDSIFYSYSTNYGNTWQRKQLIDFGEYPAIAVDEMHRVHLIYKKGNSYYYKELTGLENPVPIYTPSTRLLQSPSFLVKGDYGYLVFEEREYSGSHLMFGVFGVPPNGNFEVEEIIYDLSEFLKNPYLAVDANNTPHIVYERDNGVWYIQGRGNVGGGVSLQGRGNVEDEGRLSEDGPYREKELKIGKHNVFEHNLMYHIYNNSPDTIDARKNFWYPSEPESIAYYIYDYYDDPNLGVVLFQPVLQSAKGGAQGAEKDPENEIVVDFGLNPKDFFCIRYHIKAESKLRISVYDIAGRLIAKEDCMKSPGVYKFTIENLACGVYFIKIECRDIEIYKKVVLLKSSN